MINDGSHIAQHEFSINFDKIGKPIPDNLFGHNFETTRKTVWSGIGAEMVANRKFFAEQNGFPCCWSSFATDGSNVIIDKNISLTGDKSMMIDIINGGCAGIKQQQKQLSFKKNTEYYYRIWARSENDMNFTFKITSPQNICIFLSNHNVECKEWKLFCGKFNNEKICKNAELSISATGEGRLWLGAISVMPADNFYGMRFDVISLLKVLKPSCLRFPGGCYAEFYRWKEGLLPVDKRPAIVTNGLDFVLADSYGHDNHEIGINEFMMLCKEIGAQPEITVRLSENTPGDAADLVEYCNGKKDCYWGEIRSGLGFSDPFNVKFWYIGNELKIFGRNGMDGPMMTGKATREFSRAMKTVDPSISVAGSTWLYSDWNRVFCAEAADNIEYASYHNYILDLTGDPGSDDDMRKILKAPTEILGPKLEQAYQTLINDGCNENISICLDEWNYMWGRHGSAAIGIYTAGVLSLLCNRFEQYKIDRASYFHPINEGAIRVGPFIAELDDAGLVFSIFNNHRGNLITFPFTSVNDSQLDICASVSKDNSYGCITIINRDMHNKADVVLRLPEGYDIKSCNCTLLNAETEKRLDKCSLIVSKPVIEYVDYCIKCVLPPVSVLGINILFWR